MLGVVFQEADTYLSDIFYLDICRSGIDCFKILLRYNENQTNNKQEAIIKTFKEFLETGSKYKE